MARRDKSRKRRKRRRSKQAPPAGAAAARAPETASSPRRRARGGAEEPPPAPWGSFPLVELSVLVGIVMLVLGFFVVGGDRGIVLIGTGLVLASIGGLELAIREHLAGYRSHTVLLAGIPAVIVLGVLFYAGPDGVSTLLRLLIAAAVFAAAAVLLIRLFRERSGGLPFKLSGLLRR